MPNPNVEPEKTIGYEYPPLPVSYNRRDAILYSLGIGANDLKYTFEGDEEFSLFPTYPVVLTFKGTKHDIVPFGENMGIPGLSFDPSMILHGEQYLEVLRHPLPVDGQFVNKAKITGLYDKGKGALVVTETNMCNESGQPLVKMISGTFIRGLGGFGGDKGPSGPVNVPPQRPPDAVLEDTTLPQQALIYRLSGDYNPLHANPMFAQMVGFERPILHGLCTFGFAAKAVIKQFANNDPTKFKSISVRFSSPVLPGETLVTQMWREGRNKIIFQTLVKERNKVVISNAAVELYDTAAKL